MWGSNRKSHTGSPPARLEKDSRANALLNMSMIPTTKYFYLFNTNCGSWWLRVKPPEKDISNTVKRSLKWLGKSWVTLVLHQLAYKLFGGAMGQYLKLICSPMFVDHQFKRQSSPTSSTSEIFTSPGQLQSQLAQQEVLHSPSTIASLFGPKGRCSPLNTSQHLNGCEETHIQQQIWKNEITHVTPHGHTSTHTFS